MMELFFKNWDKELSKEIDWSNWYFSTPRGVEEIQKVRVKAKTFSLLDGWPKEDK